MTGERSQFPIARLAAKYNEMAESGRFLSNQHSLEILRTRIQELGQRIDLHQAPDRLIRLQKKWDEFSECYAADDRLGMSKAKIQIENEFESAYHDYFAWQQMFEALDLDRKLVESEVKIAKDLKAILTAKDAYELAAKLLAAIIEAANSLIFDTSIRSKFLKRIQYEFARLVGDERISEDQPGPDGSGGEIIDSVSSVLD